MVIFGGGDGRKWFSSIHEFVVDDSNRNRETKSKLYRSLSQNNFTDIRFRFEGDEDVNENIDLNTNASSKTVLSNLKLKQILKMKSKQKLSEPSLLHTRSPIKTTSTIQNHSHHHREHYFQHDQLYKKTNCYTPSSYEFIESLFEQQFLNETPTSPIQESKKIIENDNKNSLKNNNNNSNNNSDCKDEK
jgi:hypothetical protein